MIWPTDQDCERALKELAAARAGTRGPISIEVMRRVLKAGLRAPDTRTQEEKDYDFDRYLGR